MGLPAQIQRQLDEADAIQRSLTQPPEAEVGGDAAPANDAAPESTEAPPVTPEASAPAPAPEPKTDDYAQLEQRYRSLQGMWQSANARLQKAETQNAELAEKLQEAIRKLESVGTAAPAPEPAQSYVTDKDAEAFGTDLIDLARRVAKEQFGEREKQLTGQIEELKARLAEQDQRLGSVAQTQASTAVERFYGTLDSKLSFWEQVQSTAECQQWLQTRVPGTKATWNQALQLAAEEHDADRAIEVFETFLAANPTLDPRRKPAPAPSSKAELQRQVAPSKSTAASTPAGKKTYTAADYDAAMKEVIRLGKARQYDDATALENELNAALAEGRVTP